jgi:hypothetical protein
VIAIPMGPWLIYPDPDEPSAIRGVRPLPDTARSAAQASEAGCPPLAAIFPGVTPAEDIDQAFMTTLDLNHG